VTKLDDKLKAIKELADKPGEKVFTGRLQGELYLMDLAEEFMRNNFHNVNDVDEEKKFSYALCYRTAKLLETIPYLLTVVDGMKTALEFYANGDQMTGDKDTTYVRSSAGGSVMRIPGKVASDCLEALGALGPVERK
jgi:hypothetical protein